MGYLLSGSCNLKICISNNRFHTNIIVPVQSRVFDWRNHLTFEQRCSSWQFRLPLSEFWLGERAWYINTHPGWPQTSHGFPSIFLPNNASVLRVQKHYSFPKLMRLNASVSVGRLFRIDGFHQNSFRLSAQGEKLELLTIPIFVPAFMRQKAVIQL